MEDMVQGLVQKVGLSEEKAKEVFNYLKENADKVPEWLNSDVGKSIKKKLPGGIGDLF